MPISIDFFSPFPSSHCHHTLLYDDGCDDRAYPKHATTDGASRGPWLVPFSTDSSLSPSPSHQELMNDASFYYPTTEDDVDDGVSLAALTSPH